MFAKRGPRGFEPETDSVVSFYSESSQRDDPRKMASYIEEAERLRNSLPLDDLLAEASQLEAEVRTKQEARAQKLAVVRQEQQERTDVEKRISELSRKLSESRSTYTSLEQDEAAKLADFEAMVRRRQGARARIDKLHAELEQKTAERRGLQQQAKELEDQQSKQHTSQAEPSADLALVALRREKQRLEELRRRQRGLDQQRLEIEVPDSSDESEAGTDEVPAEMQGVHDDKVAALEMAKWELRAARGIAAISA